MKPMKRKDLEKALTRAGSTPSRFPNHPTIEADTIRSIIKFMPCIAKGAIQ